MNSMISILVLIGLSFSIISALPTPREGAASVELNGKVYITGGKIVDPLCFNCPDDYETSFNDLTVFDSENGVFVEEDFASFSVSRVHHTVVATDNGKLYVFGGAGSNNEIESYDIETNEWSIISPADDHKSWTVYGTRPSARKGHASFYFGNQIFIFGGIDFESGNALNDMWIFDLNTNEWNQFEYPGWLPQPRTGHSCTRTGYSAVYVFGGHDTAAPVKYFDDLWVFDAEYREWQHITPIYKPSPRAYHAADASADHILVIHGGTHPSEELNGTHLYYGETWFFDGSSWSALETPAEIVPAERAFHTLSGSYDAMNGIIRLNVIGGRDSSRETLADVWQSIINLYIYPQVVEHQQRECYPGYFFPHCTLDCSQLNWCSGNGVCLHDETCCCDAGYTGETCDFNVCEGYRGFTHQQINEVLLPKSLEATFMKLDVIAKKLEHVRELLPSIRVHEVNVSDIASEAHNFYQSCLKDDLCEVTECFEELVGCDEPCGSETFCLLNDICINNQCVNGTWRDCDEEFKDNKCVNSWCDETYGCMHSSVSCDDGIDCTQDWCDPKIGCVNEEIVCKVDDCCHLTSCQEGVCVIESKCEDLNPCTIDVCNDECQWGQCEYAFEDCCYMNVGQAVEVAPPEGVLPRPIGEPLYLDGYQMVPQQLNSFTYGFAYFWLRACDCELIYDITLYMAGKEDATHISGLASRTEQAGVVHTLPLGDHKVGKWNFCQDGVNAQDLIDGKFYLTAYAAYGDARTQIEFNQNQLRSESTTFRG